MAAETGGRIHRGASRGANFAGGSRRTRRFEPLSFCARLHAIVRRAPASLPYGPPNGSSQEPVAEAGAFSDRNRRPDRLSRNELVYEGISQIDRAYADRISPSPRGLEPSGTNRSSVAGPAPPERRHGGANPCREHHASIVRLRPAMIMERIGVGCLRRGL